MKKNIIVKCICFLMCFAAAMFMTLDTGYAENIPAERQLDRVVDNAKLLTDDEKSELLDKVNEISERQQCDVAIVTIESLDGKTAEAYADDFFDYNGYGIGSQKDGIIFLLSMSERKWAISTHGYGITAFTDAGQKFIMDNVKPLLSDGDYNKAFIEFATECDDYITQAKTGKPYDSNNMPSKEVPAYWLIITLAIGAVISFIIMHIWKKTSLTSVQMQYGADNYEVDGSMKITDSKEMFLYKNVTRTLRPKESDTGSSTHYSSSGESHGGSSGSF